MIPPKQSDLSEISQAGTYLLPFLNDSKEYSNEERERCLNLLDRIGTEEAIPALLSYIEGTGDDRIKIYALDMLSTFNDSVIEEYNSREQLIQILLNSIEKDSLTIYEGMLNIIGNERLSEKDIEKIDKVKYLHLICGVAEDSVYTGETEILYYFKECRKVILSGNIQSVYYLKQFAYIDDLIIQSDGDLSEFIENLRSNKSLSSVKNLYIEAKHLGYFYEHDLCSMKNIETFELRCWDDKLELNIDNFDYFPELKKVIIKVNEYLAKDLCSQLSIWKGANDELEIIIDSKM